MEAGSPMTSRSAGTLISLRAIERVIGLLVLAEGDVFFLPQISFPPMTGEAKAGGDVATR